jgi:hypothetical protein
MYNASVVVHRLGRAFIKVEENIFVSTYLHWSTLGVVNFYSAGVVNHNASYNASYNAKGSLARFLKQNIFFSFEKRSSMLQCQHCNYVVATSEVVRLAQGLLNLQLGTVLGCNRPMHFIGKNNNKPFLIA